VLSDLEKSTIESSSRDTSPLTLGQLSDGELELILRVEQRLMEAKGINDEASSAATRCSGKLPSQEPFATVQDRYRRVLLLDGGRGTGKTSLLCTLVRKWHFDSGLIGEKWAEKDAYRARVAPIQSIHPELGFEAPTYLRVIRILDFDPLPPGMPLLAGIIQALRPLADRYDPSVSTADDTSDDFPDTLVDVWRRLFRIAVLGWSPIPPPHGLIDELLDREEQIKDWQRIADDWQSFVWKVLAQGQRIPDSDRLTKDTVFVIMIDDVDLQVARVQELLPALRLLYHPRVFFLVAADRLHMIDMLKLEFLGQQNKLAHHRNAKSEVVIDIAKTDRWASDLAHSTFQKVFPKRNQWKLDRLSSLEFLAFPGPVAGLPKETSESTPPEAGSNVAPSGVADNFLADLCKITRQTQPTSVSEPGGAEHIFGNAGELILYFSRQAEWARLPGVMPYRAAEQLRQQVMSLKESRPYEVLARLLSEDADDSPAVAQHDPPGVSVSIAGELAALYRRGRTDLAGNYNVVLSERPDFVFLRAGDKSLTRMSTEPDNRFNFTGALIAKMLEESAFPIDAAALLWETYLSLAWTEWPSLGASFAWTRHRHPRPDELLAQTRSWAEFIKVPIEGEGERKFERYAYAWIYYQRIWSDHKVPDPLKPTAQLTSGTSMPWKELLDFGKQNQKERVTWLRSTLPLLARPELGFPPMVQECLFEGLPSGEEVKQELKRLRRRLITDAIVAAGRQRGEVDEQIPNDEKIEEVIKAIDQMYLEGYQRNRWAERIENSAPSKKRSSRPRR
jgi:hypothetical protein